jgi:CRP-like cAMP-binding protein
MPVYIFELRDGARPVTADDGVILRDREHALEYAVAVAQDLLKGQEAKARSWRLEVYEDDEHLFAIPLASVDETLDHCHADLRKLIEAVADRQRRLSEALHDARITVRESRALIAMSRGKPYLASEFGETTIRGA